MILCRCVDKCGWVWVCAGCMGVGGEKVGLSLFCFVPFCPKLMPILLKLTAFEPSK